MAGPASSAWDQPHNLASASHDHPRGADQLTFIEVLFAVIAGFSAGAINVVVGAGTLVSFPLLVFIGYPPLTATIANTIGIVPGSAAGVWVYRRELHRLRGVVARLLPASLLGGVIGAGLLLAFPAEVFSRIVPWLIGVGTVLVLLGPTIKERLARRRGAPSASDETAPFPTRAALVGSVVGAFLLGIYGGYFSAAQGILLIGLLGILSQIDLQDLNALKNLTVAGVNVIAATVFLVRSPELIDWMLAGCIAIGAILGGLVGGRFARHLSPTLLRAAVALIGVAAMLFLLLGN